MMDNTNIIKDKDKRKRETITDITLAKSLEKLVDLLSEITEFNNRQLLPISLLQTDKYFTELLSFYILNKKHVKRKFSKEILIALEHISKTIGARLNDSNLDDNKGFLNLFRNR